MTDIDPSDEVKRSRMIYQYIDDHPGCSVKQVAEWIGSKPNTVRSALASLETDKLLVCEDAYNRLYSLRHFYP